MTIEPPDCFAAATQLAGEVDLIRREMGKPSDPRPAVKVSGVSPRECWFQALAVFRKADRLCHELAGDPVASVPHAPSITAIQPGHVLTVIEAALREVAEVKSALGISEKSDRPAREGSRTPSDVFGALATLNRQLNLLLGRQFSPSDVYQQVALSVAYLSRLTGKDAPAAPAFERGKRPGDCYQRLSGCVAGVRKLLAKAGQPVIETPPDAGDVAGVLPSDCYDVASLLLCEVATLHALGNDANPPYPFEGSQPGRRLPSHVYQLAGVVEAQLQQLG